MLADVVDVVVGIEIIARGRAAGAPDVEPALAEAAAPHESVGAWNAMRSSSDVKLMLSTETRFDVGHEFGAEE